jgi:hypothetical protein
MCECVYVCSTLCRRPPPPMSAASSGGGMAGMPSRREDSYMGIWVYGYMGLWEYGFNGSIHGFNGYMGLNKVQVVVTYTYNKEYTWV